MKEKIDKTRLITYYAFAIIILIPSAVVIFLLGGIDGLFASNLCNSFYEFLYRLKMHWLYREVL